MGGLASVFPAYAGVSPRGHGYGRGHPCLPRLRGGEPWVQPHSQTVRESSPPTRG